MNTPTEKLELALSAFRREQALSYVNLLAGAEEPRRATRARDFLCSEAALELLDEAQRGGELAPNAYAASCAHCARARAEQKYASVRAESARLAGAPIATHRRSLGELCADWRRERSPGQRARIETALEPVFLEHTSHVLQARVRADQAAASLLAQVSAPRHPDAGPEGGSASAAEAWLQQTDDLFREALNEARKVSGEQGQSGHDALWIALGTQYQGLFAAPGRYRRLAAELERWGLRRQLARAARLAPAQHDVHGAAQIALVAAPNDLRVVPAGAELGLASELTASDALGRVAAHAHASPALPFALRHASAGTVARALGSVSTLRFTEPVFLRKRRELNMREAGELSRASATFVLCESRLLAAAVLARGLHGQDASGRAQALAERALLGPVSPGVASFLLTRLSASSAFRGKALGAGLVFALRERFDEDWYQNPHAGEALRGACARAGDFSVEALAAELGARSEDGPRKLSELF